MNNRVKSLEIRDEVDKLVEEKFGFSFLISYNDLYKIKDNGLVRRLKCNLGVKSNEGYYVGEENKINEFNKLIIEIDNFVKNLNYKGFEIRLKKRRVDCEERDRNNYEKYYNVILSMKEYREILIERERELILSIRFKDK
jgi:hypothetical protein